MDTINTLRLASRATSVRCALKKSVPSTPERVTESKLRLSTSPGLSPSKKDFIQEEINQVQLEIKRALDSGISPIPEAKKRTENANSEDFLKLKGKHDPLPVQKFIQDSADLELKLQEMKLQYELQIEEMKSELSKSKIRLRDAQSKSDYWEVFETYEREQDRLLSEVERLSRENASLTAKSSMGGLEGSGTQGQLTAAKLEIADLKVK